MKQLSFFNTIELPEEDLKIAEAKAENQEERIHRILVNYGSHATPYEVWAMYEKVHGETPKVSIGRALTSGTRKGLFEKVSVMKQGIYGKANYQWRAAVKP
jgi:hypothetical protein